MKKQKGTLWIQWLLSYLAILIIPALLLVYLFVFSLDVLHAQSIYMNQTVLSQFQQIIDGYLTKMNTYASSLSYDDDLEFLGRVTSADQLRNSYDFISSYQSLRKKSSLAFGGLSGEGSFYIYLRGTGTVFYDSCIIADRHFYDYYFPLKDTVSYDQWKSDMNKVHAGDFSGGIDAEGNRTLIKKLTISTKESIPVATLVTSVNVQEALDQIVGTAENAENVVILLNEKGERILSVPENAAIPPLNGEETQTLSNGDVVLQKTSFSGVSYVNLIPSNIFYAPYENTRYLLLAGALFSVLLSITFAVLFSRHNYRPITRLVKSAEPFAEETGKNSRTGEYRFIGQALERATQQSRKITRELTETKGDLRDLYLRNVLEEREKTDDPKRAEYWESLCYPYFQVFLVTSSSSGSASPTVKENISSSQVEAFFQSWLSVSGEEIRTAALTIHQNVAVIVNVSESFVPMYEKKITGAMKDFLNELENGITRYCAAGNLMEGRENLPVGYRQALISADYQGDFPEQQITFYGDVHAQLRRAKHPLYDPRDEQRFLLLAGSGDFEAARAMLDEILEQSFGEYQKKAPLAPQLILNRPGVVGVMCTLGRLYQVHAEKRQEEMDFNVSIDHFLSCSSYDKLRGELTETLRRLCEECQPDEGGNSELAERIDRLIAQSLSDVSLNVSFIANRLEMNANYISCVYKETRGSSILNRILQKRMEAAKEMLENTDKSIQCISEELGFSNSNSFIRNFKKCEGITPGQYKKIVRETDAQK